MFKGLKTHFFLWIFLLLFYSIKLNAGWLEIKILHNNKTYVNQNTIQLDIKTRELIAVKFIVRYNNTSTTEDYECWMRDGYYGSKWRRYQFPEYAEKWEDKSITISPQKKTSLENIIYIHPTETSLDTVMIWYGERTATTSVSKRWQRLILNVVPSNSDYPEIAIEPEFTQGTSNSITWYPLKDFSVQDVYYFDDADPINLRKAAQRLYKNDSQGSSRTVVFQNLKDGHTYGYFARAEIISGNDTLYMCSDFTYSQQDNSPPEKVIDIHAEAQENTVELTWQKVSDSISQVEKYIIFRKSGSFDESPVDTVHSSTIQDDIMSWIDDNVITGENIYYRVRAVDIVGNIGRGVRSNSIFISGDGNSNNDDSFENENNGIIGSQQFDDQYSKGPVDTLWIELSLEDTVQALKFETVRDSIVYFNSKPSLNMRYFSSGWVNPEVLKNRGWVSKNNTDKVYFVFDYTDTKNAFVDNEGNFQDNIGSEHIDANFVDGRNYIRRIISKYKITKDTIWLDKKIPDCFPPNDIRNLIGEIKLQESNTALEVNLTWDAALDEVSGLKRYHIFRKISGVDQDFVHRGIVTSTEFADTLGVLTKGDILNPFITYKVTSEDLVGNIRDIAASDWEFQERSLQGPEIKFANTGSQMIYPVNEDTIFTQSNFIDLAINRFDIKDVLKYDIYLNGNIQTINNVNRNTDTLTVQLSDTEVSSIKVRAVYVGNIISKWSNLLYAIRNINKIPENFRVFSDSSDWSGNIKLSWSRSSRDAVRYEIFRDNKKVGVFQSNKPVVTWVDNYGIDELQNQAGDTLIAYKNYEYKVRAVNVFGEKSDFTIPFKNYCNRAPVVISDDTKYQNNNYVISIFWKRAVPSELEKGNVKYSIRIYQDSLANLFRKTDILYGVSDDTLSEDFQLPPEHNYIFRIKEIPNTFSDMPSAWSRPYTVPDFNLFDSLQSLALPGENIFIYWDNSEFIKKFKIDLFAVTRLSEKIQPETWLFSSNNISFIDSSEVLEHGQEYTYTIKALDSLGQTLDEQAVTDTCDSVAFIPDIDIKRTPEYFREDSLEVYWQWINDLNGKVLAETTEGADSLAIQMSISNDFPSIPEQTVTTDYFKAGTERSKKIQIPTLTSRRNEKVFIRITAKDRWGHNSMSSTPVWWSNDFYPLSKAVYDTVPSPAVTDLRVKYDGPYNLASDSVLIQCSWSGANVEQGTVDANRSVLWNAKSYLLVRILNDQQWIQDEIPVAKQNNGYIYQDVTLNRNFKWQINVVDSAGNVTEGGLVDPENFLKTPPPPTPINYRSCIIPEIESDYPLEYFVEIALDPSHFELAYQNTDIRSRLLCQIGWTVTDTCTCTTGWGSIAVDTTWFRLKVREIRENGAVTESAWSNLITYTANASGGKNVTTLEESNDEIISFKLYPNRPNPFNNSTEIRYQIPENAEVTISIFNMKGSLVNFFNNSNATPGSYSVKWDGTDLNNKQVSSGIYICFLDIVTKKGTSWRNNIKMLLLK